MDVIDRFIELQEHRKALIDEMDNLCGDLSKNSHFKALEEEYGIRIADGFYAAIKAKIGEEIKEVEASLDEILCVDLFIVGNAMWDMGNRMVAFLIENFLGGPEKLSDGERLRIGKYVDECRDEIIKGLTRRK